MKKELTKHQVRCLGALMALARLRDRPAFFAREEIGRVVYGAYQGVALKALLVLRDAMLVRPEFDLAVDLVASGLCRCGHCDRWQITDPGRQVVIDKNVQVPTIGHPHRKPVQILGFLGPDGNPDRRDGDGWKDA